MKKIFISYSHSDEQWKDRLLLHLKSLELEGFLEVWDDRKILTGSSWIQEIQEALNKADAAILLVSAGFLTSDFILNVEIPRLLERHTEEGLRILPLIVEPCAWGAVEWLNRLQVYPADGIPLAKKTRHEIDSHLAVLSKKVYKLISKGKESPLTSASSKSTAAFISKLPTTGPKLFGREKELEMLDTAWKDEHTCLVTLIAWGGVGKTALVNHWLNLMEQENFRGAARVYAWSFYSQGTKEGKQASADEFLQEALKWFGDPRPEEGSPVEMGRRLARLVGKEKTLLILDGLEPLQYPPGEKHGLDGRLKDQGLKTLVKELAGPQPGLCVITTRETITDLSAKSGFTVKEIQLEHLSPDAGVGLLKELGINGPDREIKAAVKEYEGHALTLHLLGRYLCSVYGGDIRKRDLVPRLTRERKQGGHARRVMDAYEKWLGESAELDVLRIMGLFDRPANAGALAALKADPAIPGVTGQLPELAEEDWQYALSNLRAAHLLAPVNPDHPGTLDCHPLIREHFAQRLREQNPAGWQEAQQRLYLYYKGVGREYPDTMAEMEPLFAAIAHGCAAGLHHEAWVDVYWKRILRGEENFINNKPGAFSAGLAALSYFFDRTWGHPAAGLTENDQAHILSLAAVGLRALGRLQEAIQPLKTAFEFEIKKESWKKAAQVASNLSELLLTLGEVSQAKDYARQSVTHADRSGDDSWKEASRTALADALHQSGQLKEAEKWLWEAEEMQKQRQPEFPYLYSLPGFRYCDLLMGKKKGTVREVTERAEKGLEIFLSGSGNLLDIARNNLTLGRAGMMQAIEQGTDFTRAAAHLDRSLQGLREANNQEFLTRGLLARAECYRQRDQFSLAWDDLNEALEIASSGSMKLHLVDYHLEAGRLCEAEGKKQEAADHFKKAAKMIEETGYHRRDKEVEKLRS